MKRAKNILSILLAVIMMLHPLGMLSAEAASEITNLALWGTTTASSYEVSSTAAIYATDGNLSTRWGTGKNKAEGQWLQVDLGAVCNLNHIVICFERTDDAQNILGYHIEIDGETVCSKSERAAQEESIVLEEGMTGQVVKLVIDSADGGTLNWKNVGVNEFQIWGEDTSGEERLINLALGKTATADCQEASSVAPQNAVDGDTTSNNSRWGSDKKGAPHWLQVDLGEAKTVESVRIVWEQRKATAYRIQVSDDGTEWTDVKVFERRPLELDDVIVFDEPVETRYVRLYIDSYTAEDPDGGITYEAVSLYEMEVYNGVYVKPVKLIDQIEVETPQKGVDKLSVNIPESDDYILTYNGTDYEQVIGEDLTIYEPIVDTKVTVSFKSVNKSDESDYEFREIELTVPGTYTQEEGDNEAPVVIPELREWKGYTGDFTVSENAKVIISDKELQAVAEAFAADYEDMTGKAMEVVVGTEAAEGEIFLTLTEDTSLGLKDEGYLMEIEESVSAKAETATGAYWATRTILQALKSGDMTSIPKGITRDYPLYKVRGVMIDVGRKTFTMDFLKQMVKEMSWYKLNDLHLHLNDNFIFLEKYTSAGTDPMTAYSGFRLESDVHEGDTVVLNGKEFTYSADLTNTDMYYTKDEFRSFIQESDIYGVNIVPEFDAPAHSLAFTKVLPELRTGTSGRENDHLDLKDQYDESYEFITNIFDEYMTGSNPVFDTEVVHIGCDEYEKDGNAFRQFCNDMADYVESTGRTARIWGSFTRITGDGSVDVDGTGIQMNLWNDGYANMSEMYELGFDLIDCDDASYYIVPNAGYYFDYLNATTMYNDPVNSIGNEEIPSGDKQMLGGMYAVWNDMIDLYENGVSEYDVYDRLVDSMGLYAAKLWGKGEMTLAEAQKVSKLMGDAPNTNFGYKVESDKQGKVAHWTEEELTAFAENGVLAEMEIVDGESALKLAGGESYVETNLGTIGLDSELTVKVKRTGSSTEEQILFESPYGAIKAVQSTTGKVGISREGRDYSFDYELPVGEWTELTFKNEFEQIHLYVNGELTDTIGDDETVKNNNNKDRALLATCMFPAAKIGSTTSGFEGYVAEVLITTEVEREYYENSRMTVTASSEETAKEDGAATNAIDDDEGTIWHSLYSGTAVTPHWIELEMEEVQEIDGLYYQPRTTGTLNGTITSYVISVSTDGEVYTEVASGEWAKTLSKKMAEFDAVEAKYVRLDIVESANGYASASEIKLRLAVKEEITPETPAEEAEVVRLYGAGRYETGYAVADALKDALGVEKFEAVVVATGKNFADALAGSYLAVEKNAPILLTNGKADNIAALHDYIKANVTEGGKVYILGGEGAVPAEAAAIDGYDVVRLSGKSRYDTNLEILKEAGITGDSIIAATGKTFADSLSASAAKLPILLVKPNDTLNDAQKEILADMKNIYIVGGTGAVSEAYEEELAEFGEVTRVYGKSRYDTSVEVAKTFFGDVNTAVAASGKNFPDGLCGGPLAAALDAPLILTKDGGAAAAAGYIAEMGIEGGYVLGGAGALKDETVVEVFALESADEIK